MAKFQGYVHKMIYAVVTVEADTAEQAKEAIQDGVWDDLERDYCMDDYEWQASDSFDVWQADEDDDE